MRWRSHFSLYLIIPLLRVLSTDAVQLLATLPLAIVGNNSAPSEAVPPASNVAPPVPSHPGTPPPPKISSLTTPEDGFSYGSVTIVNNCNYPLYMQSVGSWYVGGDRSLENSPVKGWGTPEDQLVVNIEAGSEYSEPYRSTCGSSPGEAPYCQAEDKLKGQGVSMKISKSKDPATNKITQLEYALYQNPDRKDTFKRLNYDLSLLDCGDPGGNVTDVTATSEQHTLKVEQCPGYGGGIAITFDTDKDTGNCPPIYCSGDKPCLLIYNWDRSRSEEASFSCEKEYKGNMKVDFCLSKGKGAEAAKGTFDNWAKTATHEVLQLQQTNAGEPQATKPTLPASIGPPSPPPPNITPRADIASMLLPSENGKRKIARSGYEQRLAVELSTFRTSFVGMTNAHIASTLRAREQTEPPPASPSLPSCEVTVYITTTVTAVQSAKGPLF